MKSGEWATFDPVRETRILEQAIRAYQKANEEYGVASVKAERLYEEREKKEKELEKAKELFEAKLLGEWGKVARLESEP